jgi:hypothetical protein
VLRHGLFGGTSADAFEPDAAMTGAMLVTVLSGWKTCPSPAYLSSETQSQPMVWVRSRLGSGKPYREGFGGRRFLPGRPATREQWR